MSDAIMCDCEKGHNGCGLMVRECDCGENAIADTYWRKATLIISAMPPRTPTQFELQEVIARALMAAAKEADEAATKRAVEWRPIGTAPRDATVLVAVEATAKNMTFFGRPSQSHPAYIDDSGRVCDAGTWKPDAGLNGEFWRASHWMPLPDPPAILKGDA